jgi:hypothetical protein
MNRRMVKLEAVTRHRIMEAIHRKEVVCAL